MAKLEFIVALTEHRFLGTVFQPFLIEQNETFYSVVQFVKPRDFTGSDYDFAPYEKEIVSTIEKYSDERLKKKFSRAANATEFFTTIRAGHFERHILPFIEEQMFAVTKILMLSPVRLFKKDAKYSNIYLEDLIEVPPLFGRPKFLFTRTETETRYQLKIYLDNKEIRINKQNSKVVATKPFLLLHRNQLIAFEKLTAKKLSPFFEKDTVVVPNSIEEKYYPGFVLNTVRDFEVEAHGFAINDNEVKKKAVLSLEKNLQYDPVFVLSFQYGNEEFQPSSKRQTAVVCQKGDKGWVFSKTKRNMQWEKKAVAELSNLGLIETNGYYSLKGMDILERSNALFFLVSWLNQNTIAIKRAGFEVVQDKLEKKYFTGAQKLDFKAKSKGDWFDIHAVVHFGQFEVPFIKLKKYILGNIREFQLPNGEIAVLPEEWFARFQGLLPFAKGRGAELQVYKHHFMLLQNSAATFDKKLLESLREMENKQLVPIELPNGLNANLRSYQNEGFQWMYHLYENGFGGCLADDMGLGKTLQALALLLKLKRKHRNIEIDNPFDQNQQLSLFAEQSASAPAQPASLIVLPTSLVHNWDNEIRKFTPGLKTYKHVGAQRKNAVEIEKIAQFYDVILTTYGTVRNDKDLLAKTTFFYLILDESQSVKNPKSKTYKAVMELRAQHRLVITGTPIENSLSDLWAQMNFLNEGMLGSQAFFQKTFINPIEKLSDAQQQEKLQLMILPFVLRRKKEDVAKDLPPLMEQVVFCEMEKGQRKKYEHEKSAIRNAILENIENEGLAKSSLVIVTGLTKLRQLANHPKLLDKTSGEGSGKFDEIFRMLENVISENHKVLVFSTFVKHLELFRTRIEEENWKYSMLTGQTTKREKVIADFQNDPKNQIFLISLKAGGVGLNLTGADYVFILDPWWNPAAENQAINRAHRIGQNKHVFVYRFITQQTIEEKIQVLKERKSSLAELFVNSNNPFQKITKEEVEKLLD